MSFLLDTNVVSEAMKSSPDVAVDSWLQENQEDCYLSSIAVAEIELGIELLPAGAKKESLKEALRQFLPLLNGRVVVFDLAVGRRWGKLCAELERQGRRPPILDSMIEAMALEWRMTVVTRNTSDFVQVPSLNPWKKR